MIQTSGAIGMMTMDMCLRDMVTKGAITKELALQRAMSRTELENMLMQSEMNPGGPAQRR